MKRSAFRKAGVRRLARHLLRLNKAAPATEGKARKRARGAKIESRKAKGARSGAFHNYLALLGLIHSHLCPRTYVEIGVGSGRSLARAGPTTLCVGIDPEPKLRVPIPD